MAVWLAIRLQAWTFLHAAVKKDADPASSDVSTVEYCQDLVELEKEGGPPRVIPPRVPASYGEPQHGRRGIIPADRPALAACPQPHRATYG